MILSSSLAGSPLVTGQGSVYMLCILAYALRWNLAAYNNFIDFKNKVTTYVHLAHGIGRIYHTEITK